jgi:hypothetical protein
VDTAAFTPSFEGPAIVTCESCGRSPARRITVRRHVGLLVLQQFISIRVTACRPCGRKLIRSYTGMTVWQGWWGMISFFFNWFVLGANAWAWKRLGSIETPSISGMLMTESPRGFDEVRPSSSESSPDAIEPQAKRRSRLTRVAPFAVGGFVALGLVGWIWGEMQPDHSEPHGAPATAAAVENFMIGESFMSDYGTSSSAVQTATCTGDGETAEGITGMYTHFKCQVSFANETSDEVLVHLLEDGLLFKSTQS